MPNDDLNTLAKDLESGLHAFLAALERNMTDSKQQQEKSLTKMQTTIRQFGDRLHKIESERAVRDQSFENSVQNLQRQVHARVNELNMDKDRLKGEVKDVHRRIETRKKEINELQNGQKWLREKVRQSPEKNTDLKTTDLGTFNPTGTPTKPTPLRNRTPSQQTHTKPENTPRPIAHMYHDAPTPLKSPGPAITPDKNSAQRPQTSQPRQTPPENHTASTPQRTLGPPPTFSLDPFYQSPSTQPPSQDPRLQDRPAQKRKVPDEDDVFDDSERKREKTNPFGRR